MTTTKKSKVWNFLKEAGKTVGEVAVIAAAASASEGLRQAHSRQLTTTVNHTGDAWGTPANRIVNFYRDGDLVATSSQSINRGFFECGYGDPKITVIRSSKCSKEEIKAKLYEVE